MPIDYYGFLGKDIEAFKNKLFAKYKEVFQFFEEFNHFLQEMKFQLNVKDYDEWKITIVALFIKSLETFQSIYILVKHCLSVDAESLTRNLFEEMVRIGYCCKGEREWRRYMSLHLHNIIKLVNAAENNPKEFPEELFRRKPLVERRKEVEAMLKAEGNPEYISVEEMARETGIIKVYHSYYRTVCSYVHSNPKALEKYAIVGKNGRIEKFFWGPQIKSIIQNVFTAVEFMLEICNFLLGAFTIPRQEDIADIISTKDNLAKKYLLTEPSLDDTID